MELIILTMMMAMLILDNNDNDDNGGNDYILTTLHSWNSCWCQESVSQVLKIGASERLSHFDNNHINPKQPLSINVCL